MNQQFILVDKVPNARRRREQIEKRNSFWNSVFIVMTIVFLTLAVERAASIVEARMKVVKEAERVQKAGMQLMPPSYVLRLSSSKSGTKCSGFAIDYDKLVTASHCTATVDQAATLGGQLIPVLGVIARDIDNDIAIMKMERDGFFPELASFATTLNTVSPAYMFGHCPTYWPHVPRSGFYEGLFKSSLSATGNVEAWSIKSCGGDSGAPIFQNGEIVGMVVQSIDSDFTYSASLQAIKALIHSLH